MSPQGSKRNLQRSLMGALIYASNTKNWKVQKIRENVFPPKMKGNFQFDLILRSTENWGQLWVPL